MMALDSPVLAVVFGAVFFYLLYGVIRAAGRDGILHAEERRQNACAGVSNRGDAA